MRLDLTRWTQAALVTIQAHDCAPRKHSAEPYWMHPMRVAQTVADCPGATIEMVEAALLHDVLEDTAFSEVGLRSVFAAQTVDYVVWLTDPPSAARRIQRKQQALRRLQAAPPDVQTIKLADLLDNAPSIIEHDPTFAAVFMPELHGLVTHALTRGDALLRRRVMDLINAYCRTSP